MVDLSKMSAEELGRYWKWKSAQLEKYGRLTAAEIQAQLQVCRDDTLREVMQEALGRVSFKEHLESGYPAREEPEPERGGL